MKGTIYVFGLAGIDDPEPIECYFKHSKKEVESRLKQLQKEGYWQKGDGKITIGTRQVITRKGVRGRILVIAETNNCDWSYGTITSQELWNESR